MKALREADYAEVRRPERFIITNPSMDEALAWYRSDGIGAQYLSVDIETHRKQISMIGFAASPQRALVIPFLTPTGESYWATYEEERDAWHLVRQILELPSAKVFQNGLFDLQYIINSWTNSLAKKASKPI